MPYLITTAGKYNGRSYILFMVSTGKPGKPGKPESWKARKPRESHGSNGQEFRLSPPPD